MRGDLEWDVSKATRPGCPSSLSCGRDRLQRPPQCLQAPPKGGALCSRTNHTAELSSGPAQSRARRGEPRATRPRWFRGARPRVPALTSAARTAWSRRLPRAAQCLGDLLEMRTRGRGGLSSAGCAETRPQPDPRPVSPALGAQERGHNGLPALR